MLNKQGKGKIDWCDYSWNPISGKCHHNCSYCYMNKIWSRFPDLAKHQLKEKYLTGRLVKKPSKIFVGSSTDMWGHWIPNEWILKVLDKISSNPQHTFQFLTKNPGRYWEFRSLPTNGWYGATVDGTAKTIDNLSSLIECVKNRTIFVSFEPLIHEPMFDTGAFRKLNWIIIGADSSKGAKQPPISWAYRLIKLARNYEIPVFVKDNYNYPDIIKEFPCGK